MAATFILLGMITYTEHSPHIITIIWNDYVLPIAIEILDLS